MDAIDRKTDDELVNLYMAGSNEAFDVILSRYQDHVFSYVLLMVKDRDRANDIFQDIFVKVICSLKMGKYSDQGGIFCNWLMRIAHNVLVDSLRRYNVDDTLETYSETETSGLYNHQAYAVSMEEKLVKAQIDKDVWHMVNFLPEPQREVVNMRFRDDLPFKDIAKITKVSINTSLGRMRYALINLRRMAKGYNIMLG